MNARGLIQVVNISGGQNGKLANPRICKHISNCHSGGCCFLWWKQASLTNFVSHQNRVPKQGFKGVMAAETTEIPRCVFTAASEKFASK
ncbi:hypothetical protein BDL97_19G004400 [Sphagnum fallax]|nr:hypothetical protein BDL97_19G004400 [Sphagnum fallax]